MKCKHSFGWCSVKRSFMFIFPNEKLTFDFQGKDRKSYKVEFRCNRPDCEARRWVYISNSKVRFGKVRYAKEGKSEGGQDADN